MWHLDRLRLPLLLNQVLVQYQLGVVVDSEDMVDQALRQTPLEPSQLETKQVL